MHIHASEGAANLASENFVIGSPNPGDSVDVTQGSIKIHGTTLIIKEENNGKTIIVEGTPATFTQTLDSKNKAGKNKTFRGRAGRAVYNTITKELNLTGNAHAAIDKNEISGAQIIYNTASETYEARGNGKQRVEVILYPDEK